MTYLYMLMNYLYMLMNYLYIVSLLCSMPLSTCSTDHYPYDEHQFDTLALKFIEKTPVGQAFKRFVKFDKTIYPPVLKVRHLLDFVWLAFLGIQGNTLPNIFTSQMKDSFYGGSLKLHVHLP